MDGKHGVGKSEISDGNKGRSKHFLLLPFPAFGHITPLLELSRKIIAAGHRASLALSESFLDEMRTRQMMTLQEEGCINFVALKDGVRHVFDDQLTAETILDVTEKSSEALEAFVTRLPHRQEKHFPNSDIPHMQPVDVILADITFGAVPFEVACRSYISIFGFSPMASSHVCRKLMLPAENESLALVTNIDSNPVKKKVSTTVSSRWIERQIRGQRAFLQTNGIFINSFEALEPSARQAMSTLSSLPTGRRGFTINFIGPIVSPFASKDVEQYPECSRIINWLKVQPERSVVYLSFGTVAVASESQTKEIAEALIGMKRPFIWSLRLTEQKFLPKEAQGIIRTQSDSVSAPYVIVPWAPQKVILRDKAVRVFVSHCGWNSTLEAVYSGVPVVAWPMFADQFGNAELIEATGFGKKPAGVGMNRQRVVSREELTGVITDVAQWYTPLTENSFFVKAQGLSQAATAAVSKGGDSSKAFDSLLRA